MNYKAFSDFTYMYMYMHEKNRVTKYRMHKGWSL